MACSDCRNQSSIHPSLLIKCTIMHFATIEWVDRMWCTEKLGRLTAVYPDHVQHLPSRLQLLYSTETQLLQDYLHYFSEDTPRTISENHCIILPPPPNHRSIIQP